MLFVLQPVDCCRTISGHGPPAPGSCRGLVLFAQHGFFEKCQKFEWMTAIDQWA
jgi:hypothetical protein